MRRVEPGGVPGVCYGRADVHQLSVRDDIIPEFVASIDERDGGCRTRRHRRGVSGQAQEILFARWSEGGKAKSRADGQFIRSQGANIPFVSVRTRADSQALVCGARVRVEK